MTIDIDGLNQPQREAVMHGGGPLLILAGAGTGKTRTLAYRVASLVDRGVPAENILAVAFTNKSADELRDRVRRVLGKGRTPPLVSTFHSFCVRVLRRDIERLGFKKNFSIYSTPDQTAVLRDVAKETRLPGRGMDLKRLQWIISRSKNDGRFPDAGDGSDDYQLMASLIYPRYMDALKAYNALDFDDLLVLTLRLFNEYPDILGHWKDRCRHVLVDEFQDTNTIQYRMVSLLARPEGNLTAVGDDDQSIYGWRGAVPDNILGFSRDWKGARVLTLDQNYRSTNRILAASNAVISGNPRRRPKKLWSALGEGAAVTLVTCADGQDEAEAAVSEIALLTSGGKLKPSDCAVIFRTNAQSRPFEDALRAARLRYVVVGGMRFYDRKEVRDFLSYLAAICNPRDEVSILRIINYPHRGIGRETILRLQEKSLKSKKPLIEVLPRAGEVTGLGDRQLGAIDMFLSLLDRFRKKFRPLRLAASAQELILETGMEEAIYNSRKDGEAGMRRVENVREAVASIAAFEEANPGAGLGDYLTGVNLAGREDDSALDSSDQAVKLITVHSAKGLEFPHVFFAGLEEGLLPHKRSELEPGGLEEERRLAYVGMTRAKRKLVLSHAALRITRGEKETRCVPSRFLEEIPEEAVERIDRRSVESSSPEEEAAVAGDFFAWVKNT